MTGIIRLSEEDLNARISEYESKWSDFAETYATPTCCPGCLIPFDRWGFDQVNDWATYTELRWLRGDDITREEYDD